MGVFLLLIIHVRPDPSGDPLFLQNLDHSCMILMSSVLKGNNYLAWSRSMKIAFLWVLRLNWVLLMVDVLVQ